MRFQSAGAGTVCTSGNGTGPPKSRKSFRRISVTESVMHLLADLKSFQGCSDFLFPDDAGAFIDPDKFDAEITFSICGVACLAITTVEFVIGRGKEGGSSSNKGLGPEESAWLIRGGQAPFIVDRVTLRSINSLPIAQ